MDWDIEGKICKDYINLSFNSPVGIRWIGTQIARGYGALLVGVSIPQSEFDGLGPAVPVMSSRYRKSFNSPVGIRWIGTPETPKTRHEGIAFQFPSRNSMDWDFPRISRDYSLSHRFQFPSRNSMDWDSW